MEKEDYELLVKILLFRNERPGDQEQWDILLVPQWEELIFPSAWSCHDGWWEDDQGAAV